MLKAVVDSSYGIKPHVNDNFKGTLNCVTMCHVFNSTVHEGFTADVACAKQHFLPLVQETQYILDAKFLPVALISIFRHYLKQSSTLPMD